MIENYNVHTVFEMMIVRKMARFNLDMGLWKS